MRRATALPVQSRGALAFRAGVADVWRARLLRAAPLNLGARTWVGTTPCGFAAGGPKASASVSFLRFQSLVLYIAGSYRREIYKRVCPGVRRETPEACFKHFAELLINHRKRFRRLWRLRMLIPPSCPLGFLTCLCASLSGDFRALSSGFPVSFSVPWPALPLVAYTLVLLLYLRARLGSW